MTEVTSSVWCLSLGTASSPVNTSKIATVVSLLPDATKFESAENATVVTRSVWIPSCVLILRNGSPCLEPQTITVSSKLPETSNVESGEKAREETRLVCPINSFIAIPASTSQRTRLRPPLLEALPTKSLPDARRRTCLIPCSPCNSTRLGENATE